MQKELQELQELIKKQFDLKMRHGAGQLTKNHLLRDVRKNIARKKTFIRQLELAENKSSVGVSK